MKKILSLVLALCMIFALTACSGGVDAGRIDEILSAVKDLQAAVDSYASQAADAAAEEAEKAVEPAFEGQLIVYAAASLTETLTEIETLFEAENPGVDVVFTFGSSGDLKKAIAEEAEDVDVFISAGQKQMNQLDIDADPEVNTDGLDYVVGETRFNILENKVALAVPEGNPAGIESYDDLAAKLAAGEVRMAMGGAEVPVGEYTQKILAYYELDQALLEQYDLITYGNDVKAVTSQVSEAVVDCGVIYQTDAFSAGLEVVDTATKDMCGQVIYPAAVMKLSTNPELAQAFLDFCRTPEASAIFESVGFTPLA